MTKYIKATLHANGETVDFSTPVDAERLRAAFDANYFKSADGSTEYGVTTRSSEFAVFEIDQTPTPLNPKPSCDNYEDCTPNTNIGTVIVKYIDEADPTGQIAPDEILIGNVGDPYRTAGEIVITGYTFKEVQGNASGVFTEATQTVTYVYTKD